MDFSNDYLKAAFEQVINERERQHEKGFTLSHNLKTSPYDELPQAALMYIFDDQQREIFKPYIGWPWNSAAPPSGIETSFKPGDRIADLTKAAALIMAELERLIYIKNNTVEPEKENEIISHVTAGVNNQIAELEKLLAEQQDKRPEPIFSIARTKSKIKRLQDYIKQISQVPPRQAAPEPEAPAAKKRTFKEAGGGLDREFQKIAEALKARATATPEEVTRRESYNYFLSVAKQGKEELKNRFKDLDIITQTAQRFGYRKAVQDTAPVLHLGNGTRAILAERTRQILKGYTPENDAAKHSGELIGAALFTILRDPKYYPQDWSKKIQNGILAKSNRERLAVAGALIAAEIDRLNHLDKINQDYR